MLSHLRLDAEGIGGRVIWFTSDTHFNHENIVKYSNRPFTDLGEMTEVLVKNWNEVVEKGDTVYHLGDFALSYGKQSVDVIDKLLSRLNGQKHLIKGNHDRKQVLDNSRWASVRDYHEIKVDLGGIHKQRIVMSHYAFRVWNQMHRGAWMLHGHSHGNLHHAEGKIMDVGVDCHFYRPISLDTVIKRMELCPISCYDHHIPE
jgi:calcineurin-like phosphoesterase family protein